MDPELRFCICALIKKFYLRECQNLARLIVAGVALEVALSVREFVSLPFSQELYLTLAIVGSSYVACHFLAFLITWVMRIGLDEDRQATMHYARDFLTGVPRNLSEAQCVFLVQASLILSRDSGDGLRDYLDRFDRLSLWDRWSLERWEWFREFNALARRHVAIAKMISG